MSVSDKHAGFKTITFEQQWVFAARSKDGYKFEFDAQGYWIKELPTYSDQHLFTMLEGDFNRGTVSYGSRFAPVDPKAKKMRQLESQKRDLSMLQIEQLKTKQMQAAEATGRLIAAKQEEYDTLADESQEAITPIAVTAKDLLEGELSLTEKQARGFARSMQQSLFYYHRYLTNYFGEPEFSVSVCREDDKIVIKLHTETEPELYSEFKIRISDLTDKNGEPQRAPIKLILTKSKESATGYWDGDGYHYNDQFKDKKFLSTQSIIISAQNDPVRLEHNKLASRLEKLRAKYNKLNNRTKENKAVAAVDKVTDHITSRMSEIHDELEDNTKNRVLICKNKLPTSIQWDKNCVYLVREGNDMVAYYYKGAKLMTSPKKIEDFDNFRDLYLNTGQLAFTEKEDLSKIGSFYGFNKGLVSQVDYLAEKLNQRAVTNPFLFLTDAQLEEALINANKFCGLDAKDSEIKEVSATIPVKQSEQITSVQLKESSESIQSDSQKKVEANPKHEEQKAAKMSSVSVPEPKLTLKAENEKGFRAKIMAIVDIVFNKVKNVLFPVVPESDGKKGEDFPDSASVTMSSSGSSTVVATKDPSSVEVAEVSVKTALVVDVKGTPAKKSTGVKLVTTSYSQNSCGFYANQEAKNNRLGWTALGLGVSVDVESESEPVKAVSQWLMGH